MEDGTDTAPAMEEVLTVLYAFVPVVSAAGWVPQIVRLLRQPDLGEGLSLPTWAMWAATGVVGLLYSAFVGQDILVTAFFAVAAAGQSTMLALALRARWRARKASP